MSIFGSRSNLPAICRYLTKLSCLPAWLAHLNDFSKVRRVFGSDVRICVFFVSIKIGVIDSLSPGLTNRILDAQAVELCLCEPTPYLWYVDLGSVIQNTIDKYSMLDQYVDSHGMLFVLLVYNEGFLVEPMVCGDLGNLACIIVLLFIDVAGDLAFVGMNRCEEKQILQILVVAERRALNDDFLQQFNEFDRKVSGQESFDSD